MNSIPVWSEDDFCNVKEVGRGTYGRVETMRCKRDRRFVASKVYAGDEREGWRWDVIREIAVLKIVAGHSSCVRFLGVFSSVDGPRVLMEGMQRNLKEHYRDDPSKRPVRRHALQILSALAYLNELQIYHRDLKPQNILANDREVVKLADFGMAARYSTERAQTLITCTLWYRAPEIWTTKRYSLNVDIWSLGCTLAEVVSTHPLFAFEENDMAAVHARFPTATRLAIDETKKVLPEVADMLNPNPDTRPTAQQMLYRMGEESRTTRSRKRRRNISAESLWARQTDINNSMRIILVDWMVEVCKKFRLTLDTLDVSICILDRILSTTVVMRKHLQKVGLVAMIIAAKTCSEPDGSPEMRDFVYICDNAYSREELLAYEDEAMGILNFDLMKFPLLPYTKIDPGKMLLRIAYMFSDERQTYTAEDVLQTMETLETSSSQSALGISIKRLVRAHGSRKSVKLWLA